MNPVIKILIAEHNIYDLEMIETELKTGGIKFVSEVVQNESGYRKALKNFIPDIILCDFSFPSFDGPAAFKIREEIAPATPFILVSGTIGEESSIVLIENGVTDFVLKDKMFTLNTKLVRALKEAKERKEKNKTEQDLKQTAAHLAEAQSLAKLGSWDFDVATDKLVWSAQLYKVFDTDKQTFDETHASFLYLVDEADRSKAEQVSKHTRETGDAYLIEYGITTHKGEKRVIQEHGYGVKNEAGKVIRMFGTAQDITESKKAAAALQQAYDEKNMVLESIDDGFFATDKKSLISYWNRKAEILLGVKKVEILGLNLYKVFADSRSPVFLDNFQKALRENSTIRFEAFSARTKKWFSVSAFGSDNGLSVYFKDITQQKSEEEKLKESELRYRSLIEQSTDTICIADASGKFIEMNPSGCKMFGYSRAEMLQLLMTDVLFEEDLKTNPIKIEELKAGKTISNERRVKRKDGTATAVELNAKMLEDGRLMIFGRDISERKESERLIKESEAKYRSFFESSMDGILLTVTDGEILSANPAACEIFKMTEAEICAAGRMGVVDLSDPRLYALIEERQQTGKAKGELTLLRKDGNKFEAELTSAVFTDSYGRDRTSMIVRDISERKQQEEKLATTLHNLQQTHNDLTKVMDSSQDVICAVNAKGYFVKVSAAAESVWGYKPSELIGKLIFDFVYPEDREKTQNQAVDVMSGNSTGLLENRYVRKDGTVVPIEWSVRWDETDQLRYGVARDVTDKKRLEKANEIERRRFLGLYLQAPSSMGILKGPNHVFEMANPLYLQLINRSDIIGKTVKEVLPELESQGIFELLDEVYKTGNTFSANEMLFKLDRKGNGELVDSYLNFIYQAHRNHEGQIDGIVFFAIDVTEQVLSRRKIEESGKRYRQIVETAQEGIWLIDEYHKTTFVNSKMCEILEYSEAEMMGKEIYFFMDEEGKERVTDLMELIKAGQSGQGHFKYISKSGNEVWTNLSANPLFDEKGVYKGSLGMVTDITQSKKAERKDQFQATLLNKIGQATIATDMQGKINYWNKAASNIYGWTAEEVLGKNIIDITPIKQTKEQAEQIMQELSLGNTWSNEFVVKRKDGTEFPAFVTNAPIYDEQQQLMGIIGVSYDITSQKEAELRLTESNERYKRSEVQLNELNANLQVQAKELAISNLELEQFAYVASHDLQEPLRMVTSFLKLLEKKYGAVIDDKGRAYIDFAVDGAKRMRQIILDLLEFSRVGRTEEKLEDIDLNELVDEVKILCRKTIQEKNALIISERLPRVTGYRSPLLQVFQNLIGNALKYTTKDCAARIKITSTEFVDHWEFAVHDNGIGIEQEYFDKIFIIFQRLHTREEFSGTGMGLAITKKILENQGGKIWVESEEGTGSTFYFTLLKKIHS